MDNMDEYLEMDFVIWNSNLGVHDFVTIGEIDTKNNTAYLDDPYEMVGPFSLDELCTKGEIDFAACVVMSKENFKKKQSLLFEETLKKQRKTQQNYQDDIYNYNKKKKEAQQNLEKFNEIKYRKLLNLPIKGDLEIFQIKAAFRKIVKIAHPDLGGSDENFIKILEARDRLLNFYVKITKK